MNLVNIFAIMPYKYKFGRGRKERLENQDRHNLYSKNFGGWALSAGGIGGSLGRTFKYWFAWGTKGVSDGNRFLRWG